MVQVGTLDIDIRADSGSFTRGLTAASSAFSAFADGARLAQDALQALNEVSQQFQQNQAIANAFNISRQEYERFRLADIASLNLSYSCRLMLNALAIAWFC